MALIVPGQAGISNMRVAGILTAAVTLWAGQIATAQSKPITLQPDRLPGMCVTLAGPDGESISLPCNGAARQEFVLPETDRPGPIMQDAKCMAVKDDNNYPPMTAQPCDGSPEQTWTVTADNVVKNGVGRCLSILGASSRTGEMVYGGRCPQEEQFAHRWQFRSVDFTNVIVASLESKLRPGMCIGYDTGLGLYPCSDQYRQVISFDEKALGQMRMMSSCFAGGYAFGGLGLGDCHDVPAQKWMLMSGGRVANQLVQCIEVVNENGRDVLRTTKCSDSPGQQWTVRKPPADAH